jgi:6-phosphofructokinase 2
MAAPKIVTLTLNPAIDKSSAIDSVASEIKMYCDEPVFDPGGGGLNVSRAIKKLGGDSLAIFACGGPTGEMLTMLLEREGLTMQPIATKNLTRENLIVLEKSTGVQFRFGMPGAHLSEAELQACTDAALNSGAEYLVASGSLPPGAPTDYYAQLTKAGRAKGMKVIVDTSGKALEALDGSDPFLLKPNIGELEMFSKEKFQGEKRLREVGQMLIARNLADALVVSLGAGGATLITREKFVQMRPPVVPVRSKVGAGDSMVGGIVWALSEGKDLVDAVRWGIATGSAAVMSDGTSLDRIDDAHELYPQISVMGA